MPIPAQSHTQPISPLPSIWRRLPLNLALIGILFLLAACAGDTSTSQSNTQNPTPTATPTSTIPKGTELYKADWSHGLQGWQGASGWQIQHNELYSKGGSQDELILPYQSTTNNYAVEIKVQVKQYKARSGGSFIFSTQRNGQIDGYIAGVSNLITPDVQVGGLHPQLQAYINPQSDAVQINQYPFDYDPRTEVHVYRLEIHDNILDFFADGVKAFTVSSAVSPSLSRGPLHIKSHNIILRVASLTITAL
ncbi:hypothetical protein [Ktedonospora formicarum]|uniref:3-keto-disaccharide hydrolase domain-containing protein n=1 Tax=Ktedonospora formicarum TaxID=2778364 RepID=A0A8J3HXY1_9CHLR|nr:hypothetical protein [Ktedonospora formicarum]GHO45779.1 hypothetical protein KSX_39420 [Ktedonospora formicarum]